MNAREFQKYLDRDKGCLHCGDVETAVPHHRQNRGMGGSKARHRPSNIIVMCAYFNGMMEGSSEAAKIAIEYGWKLPSWDDPTKKPVYSMVTGQWVYLTDTI